MDKNYSSWDFPTDALVEILLRLPPNARRRLRLVCRHWRELIAQRTATDMRMRTTVIAVAEDGFTSIVDLLTPAGVGRGLWRTDLQTAIRYSLMSIVGTCNGLVCLCDDGIRPCGAITVANPFTGEALPLPPLLKMNDNNSSRSWHQTYSFAYHHRTGRYKVVHVPCHLDHRPDIVHVFTLGEASWREVHTETDARCSLGSSHLTDVDGTVYWLTEDPGKIMSFDLKHERATRIEPLPTPAMPSTYYSLTKVHGRLGVAVCEDDDDSVTVWVLEGESWIRRYILEAHCWRELAGPYLVHGDYFLTLTREANLVLRRHRVSQERRSEDGAVQIGLTDVGEVVLRLFRSIYQTFVFVETEEPLSVYSAFYVHN